MTNVYDAPSAGYTEEELAFNEQIIERVKEMLVTLSDDASHYNSLHEFANGEQTDIRVPPNVDGTVKDIVKRSVANFMPLAISVPSQLSFVDGYTRVEADGGGIITSPPEWHVWNRCGFKAKHTTLFRTALKFGVAYVAVEGGPSINDVQMKLLSTRDTMAYYEDPVNDHTPVYAISRYVSPLKSEPDLITYYDRQYVVKLQESKGRDKTYDILDVTEHGLSACPVVRFPCYMDDEGNTSGVVEELRVAQNRVNQTVFDLLLTQTFSSKRVRYAAGLQGKPVMDGDGNVVKDENGYIQYEPMNVDPNVMIMTDNDNAKFGTFEETPLDGFISSFDSAVKTLAVLGSIPPHSLLGSMANLSGETIAAAMGQTSRHTHMLKTMWAECIEEVMKLVREAGGIVTSEDYYGEVRWRDMSDASMSQISDALGKLAQNLSIPVEGLWSRVPEVTDAELRNWELLKEQSDALVDESALDPQAAAQREVLGAFGSVDGIAQDSQAPTPAQVFGNQGA